MKKSPAPYSSLVLMSIIVVELVVGPAALGGLFYFISNRLQWNQSIQLWGTLISALLGMVIAFYRINLISKRWK
jgi:hypothetical protein